MADRTHEGVPQWSPKQLEAHLQHAIDLELWTIPYYMSAMYSIKDPASEAYRLIQSVTRQEMLHVQLACNLANAFGFRPKIEAPTYGGPKIPHLDFQLDEPDPTSSFTPYSTEIGPLDERRINTMALIEYPEWRTGRQPDVQPNLTQYGSIGEFYDAIRVGVTELRGAIRGGVNQVDLFGSYYNRLPSTTITKYGDEGYQQALSLLDVIVEQGEGQTKGDADILPEFQNTADGFHASWPHFRKFIFIRDMQQLPETFEPATQPNSAGQAAQTILMDDFHEFIKILHELFGGGPSEGFGALMAKLGGDILTCWQHGAIPKFS